MSSTDSDQITDEALASSISDDGRLSSEAFDADEEGIVEAGIPPQAPDSLEGDQLSEEAFSVDDFDADLSIDDSVESTEPNDSNVVADSSSEKNNRIANTEVDSVESTEQKNDPSSNGQVAEFRKTLSALSRQLEVDRLTFLYQQLQADGNELPSLERIASDIKGEATLHALGDHDLYSKRPLARLQGWISGLSFGLGRRAKKFSR
jgi:hypothetical protein